MIWAAFAGNQKSRIVFMPKDRWKALDFVDLVYNGEFIHFLTSGPSGVIFMEDGAPNSLQQTIHNLERAMHDQQVGMASQLS
jgi:hypothetical protein